MDGVNDPADAKLADGDAIPDEAWSALRTALYDYLVKVAERWKDPAYRIQGGSGHRYRFRTTASDAAVRLPKSGHPIRGLPGTAVELETKEAEPAVKDQFNEFWFESLLGSKPPESLQLVTAARQVL